jgi:imidazolonepropionase-like amidohydrolase
MGDPPGADLYAAGPCLTAPGGHCTEYRIPTRTISTPEEARREVGELAAKRPDVVKLVYAHVSEGVEETSWNRALPSIDRATLEAAIAAAAEHDLRTVVHVRSWRDVREASEAGATAVTHLPDREIPADLPAFLAERGTVVIPTLATLDTALVTDLELLDDPMLRVLISAEVLDAYRRFLAGDDVSRQEGMVRAMASARERKLASLAALAAAGVPIVAGTDSGNPFTVQGFSLHRELEMYGEAGLEPMAVLRTATTAPAALLGRGERWGLAPGDPASLLILDASPLEDIRNTRAIHAVVHHGRVVERGPLTVGR